MALDIYVMPLWRFKAGDFHSPIEVATGLRPKILTIDGVRQPPNSVGWLERWRARRDVKSLRRTVERANGVPIRWTDEGPVAYSAQSGGMESLRAYARWLDHRDQFPEFDPPPDGDYYQHPAFVLESERPLSCPHLVGHDCHSGYFLPCDFERLTEVEPYLVFGHWPASRSVGSSLQLRRELASIAERLPLTSNDVDSVDDPLAAVTAAFRQLQTATALSCQHGLPLIFWG